MICIVRVNALDEQVLRIGVGRRETPGEVAIVAHRKEGLTGQGCAGAGKFRRDDTRQVPDARRHEAQMGVVGQQRFAAGAAVAIDDPLVGRARLEQKFRNCLIDASQIELLKQPNIARQGRWGIAGFAGP